MAGATITDGKIITTGGCAIGAANTARINSLDQGLLEIRSDYKTLNQKLDTVHSNINKILGGIVVACVLLVINLLSGVL